MYIKIIKNSLLLQKNIDLKIDDNFCFHIKWNFVALYLVFMVNVSFFFLEHNHRHCTRFQNHYHFPILR